MPDLRWLGITAAQLQVMRDGKQFVVFSAPLFEALIPASHTAFQVPFNHAKDRRVCPADQICPLASAVFISFLLQGVAEDTFQMLSNRDRSVSCLA